MRPRAFLKRVADAYLVRDPGVERSSGNSPEAREFEDSRNRKAQNALGVPAAEYSFASTPVSGVSVPRLQPKLEIGSVDDPLEREADDVADRVMRMPDSRGMESANSAEMQLQRKCSCGGSSAGEQCEECKKEKEEKLQRSATSTREPGSAPPIVHEVLQSPGRQLETDARSHMGSRFGYDFSRVRIHADEQAAESARAVNARAYTVGQHVVFGQGQYEPATAGGARLIAHELTHVLQQSKNTFSLPALMRKVDAPTDEQLASEIPLLYMRLQFLQEEEERKGISTVELAATQRKLAEKEALASEKDPVKRQILFCRTTLLELRDQFKITPRSAKRDELAGQIAEYQSALAEALSTNIKRLDQEIKDLRQRFQPGDFGTATAINQAEKELTQNQAEFEILRRIFPSEKAEAYRLKSKNEIRPLPGGGCMTAVYKGVEALYSPAESAQIKESVVNTAGAKGDKLVEAAKKRGVSDEDKLEKIKGSPNCVDLIMETMTKFGKAGPPITLKFDRRKNTWSPSAASTVLGMVTSEFLGWYFFGMSLSGGYHSVILAVDNSQGTDPQIYWMDQFSKGFKNNVTKTLEKEMKDYNPSYGYADTRIWPLLPPSSAGGGTP